MSNVVELFPPTDAERVADLLADLGVSIYVQVGKAADAWCGATILFDIKDAADIVGATALMKTTCDRFYADAAFREALSRYCFNVGGYLQHWNEPVPNPNF